MLKNRNLGTIFELVFFTNFKKINSLYVRFMQWIKSKLPSKSRSTNLLTALKSFSSLLEDQGGDFLLSLCYLFDLEPHSRLFLQFLMILEKT